MAGGRPEILKGIGAVDKSSGLGFAGEFVGTRAREAEARHVDHSRIENPPPFDRSELSMRIILFRPKRHRAAAETTAAEGFHEVCFVRDVPRKYGIGVRDVVIEASKDIVFAGVLVSDAQG